VVELDVGQGSLAVVGAVVDIDDLQLLLEQLNGRQDAVAVQAVGVQAIGWKLDVVTKPTPALNRASSNRCRIMASVTSATWNSSKQISL
jgi:hypothetical protein